MKHEYFIFCIACQWLQKVKYLLKLDIIVDMYILYSVDITQMTVFNIL